MATNDLGELLEIVRASERVVGMVGTLQMLANQAGGIAEACPSLTVEADEIRRLVLEAGEVANRAMVVLDVKIGAIV